MKKTNLILVMLLLAACVSMLTGCSSEEEKAFQGKWANGNAHYWSEWNFNEGTYSYYFDNNFTNIYESGRYRITGKGEDYVDVELFNRSGGIDLTNDAVDMRIQFKDGGMINNKGGNYYPVVDSSLQALATAKAPLEK